MSYRTSISHIELLVTLFKVLDLVVVYMENEKVSKKAVFSQIKLILISS